MREVFRLPFVVSLALCACSSVSAGERSELRVDISLCPYEVYKGEKSPDNRVRYYKVAGRQEPVFWDPVFPIVVGDFVEVRVLPDKTERELAIVDIALDEGAIRRFRPTPVVNPVVDAPPWEITFSTAGLKEGWHKVGVFCQQRSNNALRASAPMKFLLVRTLEDKASVARIAVLEKLASELVRQSAEQKTAYGVETARLADEQAAKVARWQEASALAEPIAVGEEVATTLQPGEGGWRLEGAFTAGGGVSYSSPPAELRTGIPTAPRRKVTLQSIGELTILTPGRQTVRVDYEVADGRKLSKTFVVNRKLTLQGVSVPLTVTATLGNVRVTRELILQNPIAVIDFKEVK
ncbi:MAG: hypothetical protein CEN89_22 [Candidatus Berkelbacteria bacterium Licking1014_7]|uniref:Uncharacterized protein n=1 Tax=Candidatus Berkelbacteria bacterium Licking1014_7 TaxID=2017147 RepID=A0A554LKS6_9BACT|nr:MAG: hypothetical protein CEN89_22 [Candidatus Berkelbacteria bacterium Licking1014_7]